MIVRQFLYWLRTAPAGERAEATGALARAYLYSDLSSEVRAAEACLVAVENPDAEIAPPSFDRIITRFGRLGAIREALFARPELPLAARHVLMAQLSSLLADFVVDREWLSRGRADQAVR